MSDSLERYCELKTLETEEAQFCYNIDTFKMALNKVLNVGADEYRVCKKVKAMNPDFCSGGKTKKREEKINNKPNVVHLNERHKRGIIYI